jgi:25S rRNA (uracil2634-N3)-methyltransferase
MCPGTKLAQPKYRLLRSFEFVPAAYPGYSHRRTIGWREGKSFANNEEILGRKGKARTWEFAVREEEDD